MTGLLFDLVDRLAIGMAVYPALTDGLCGGCGRHIRWTRFGAYRTVEVLDHDTA